MLLAATILLISTPTACRADGRPVRAEELPAEARQMIHTYFNNDPIQLALYDREWDDMGYEVRLKSGTEIDFTRSGRWIHVDCAPQSVPEGLIPSHILDQVKRDYPGHRILKVERDRRGYELTLSGDFELKFSNDGRLVGYDD